jgi:hypothetical protein
MARQPKWDHKHCDYLEEGDYRRFCAVCLRRRKQNDPSDSFGPVRMCPKDSINYSEMLPSLGLGQRNAMLVFGQKCEEVHNMPPRQRAVWASMDEAELLWTRREWEKSDCDAKPNGRAL